jgi:aminopeptidase N
MLRQLTWSALWDMVRDARLPVPAYLGAVERFAPGETDDGMLTASLDRAAVALSRYVPEGDIETVGARLFEVAMGALRAVDEPGRRVTWARSAIAFASRETDLDVLTDLLDAGGIVDGFRLDQDMRWSILIAGAAHDRAGARERLRAESARDGSDRGERALLRAAASWPDAAAKDETWERIHGAGYGSDYRTRAAMAGFQWRHQRNLLQAYRTPFVERVREVYRVRDHAFARPYVRWLAPDRWAEPEVVERIHALVAGLDGSEMLLARQLREVADDLERAIRVRAAAAGLPALA